MELKASNKELEIINQSRIELEPGIVEEDSIIINPIAFEQALKKLLEKGTEGPIKSRNVILSVPEEKTFSHYLDVPGAKVGNSDWVIEFAKDYVPIDLKEAAVDYRKLKAVPSQKETRLDFVAVQKSIVNPLITVLEKAGLNVLAIDVRKNSLVRACHNPFEKDDKNVLMVEIGLENTVASIFSTTKESYTINLGRGGLKLLETIKAELGIKSLDEARARLYNLVKSAKPAEASEGGTEPKQEGEARVKQLVEDYLASLIKKVLELQRIVQGQVDLKVDEIHLIGPYLDLPGLKEALKKAFPQAVVLDRFKHIRIDGAAERHYANAIGLAMRSVFPAIHENAINLLPQSKVEALYLQKLVPALRNSLLGGALVLGGLMIFTGLTFAKSYVEYITTGKEVAIAEDKLKNPYLNQVVQATQQKTQLENQISSIIADTIPISAVIEKIDAYNENGIRLVNVVYYLDALGEPTIQMRAKTASRTETEAFITSLEKDSLFAEVISPLSNLVSKGERFIQIDLRLDKTVLRDLLEEEMAPIAEEETSEPVSEERSDDEASEAGEKEQEESSDEGEAAEPENLKS